MLKTQTSNLPKLQCGRSDQPVPGTDYSSWAAEPAADAQVIQGWVQLHLLTFSDNTGMAASSLRCAPAALRAQFDTPSKTLNLSHLLYNLIRRSFKWTTGKLRIVFNGLDILNKKEASKTACAQQPRSQYVAMIISPVRHPRG